MGHPSAWADLLVRRALHETLARLSEEAALFGFVVVDVVIEKCPTAVLGEPAEYTRVRSMPQTADPERRWKATTIGNRGSTTLIRKPLRFTCRI